MLTLIRGVVRSKSPFTVVLDVQGIGFEILCTQRAYESVPDPGREYEVATRFIVREESMTLFGFSDTRERALFDRLISVSGIGPRIGLAILSSIGAGDLQEAIRTSDIHRLIAIPGVGKKTAERLIVELRDVLVKEEFTAPVSGNAAISGGIRSDAIQALISLGFGRPQAERAIQTVLRDEPEAGRELQSLIRAALKQNK